MAYSAKGPFVNNTTPPINAAFLNDVEAELTGLDASIASLSSLPGTVSSLSSTVSSLSSTVATKADSSALAAKADDSVVVKLTGDQTKSGVLTFSNAPVLPNNSIPNAAIEDGAVSGVKIDSGLLQSIPICVQWDATTSTWPPFDESTTRVHLFFSQNDAAATAPVAFNAARNDVWFGSVE